MSKKVYLLIFLAFTVISDISAQKFGLNAVIGVNAAQIRGDMLAGYDKLGITGGLRLTTLLKDKVDLNVELLYSMRGSHSELSPDNSRPQAKINADYVEIPVYVSLVDWYIEEEDYYRVQVHAGMSYGRLINSSTVDEVNGGMDNFDFVADAFSQNDFSYLFGASYFTGPSLGFTVRYTRSINNLFSFRQNPDIFSRNLKGFFLTFRMEYIF